MRFRVHDSIENILLLLRIERRMSKQQFVKKYTKSIVINLKIMPTSNLSSKVLGKHFRCHILRTPTIRISDIFDLGLRQAEICYFHVSVFVEQNILKLHVSEQNFLTVKIAQPFKNLTEYKLGFQFSYKLSLLDQLIKIAIRTILQAKNNIIFALQSIAEINQSGMVDSKQNILLILQHLIFVFSHNGALLDELQRTQSPVNHAPCQIN